MEKENSRFTIPIQCQFTVASIIFTTISILVVSLCLKNCSQTFGPCLYVDREWQCVKCERALNYYIFLFRIRRCSSSSFIGSLLAGYFGARVWSSRAKVWRCLTHRSWSDIWRWKKTDYTYISSVLSFSSDHSRHTHTLIPLFDVRLLVIHLFLIHSFNSLMKL